MSPITTHVLDVSIGRPAANLAVELEVYREGAFREIARRTTNGDGRITDWLNGMAVIEGRYRIRFDTASYFMSVGVKEFFYPTIEIVFEIRDPTSHFHVPLLLAPFGYTTYRGS